jgi:hypothetical protein
MSLFDFPRINLMGTLGVSPGTANNDDFAGQATLPEGYGPYTGQTLALIDSKIPGRSWTGAPPPNHCAEQPLL